jgi:hypothetical protein
MTDIAAPSYSYSYQNKIRSVDEVFKQLIASMPIFAAMIPYGQPTTNTKHEWIEDQVTPTSSTIASFDTDGDGTGINLASTSGMEVGSILRFATSADVSRTEVVKIASVDSATDLTVVRDYGGSTGVTLVVGDKVYLVASPRAEGTEATANDSQEADMNYNYTQIFDRVAKVTKTSQAVRMYGVDSALNQAVLFQLAHLAYDLNNSAIYNYRVERSASQFGTMGGVLQYLAGGNIDTTGGAFSATILNNMLEDVYLDGNMVKDLVLLCNTNQARVISTFLTASNQPIIQKPDIPTQSYGYAINKFYGDLPVNTNFAATVAVDPSFPKDEVALLDMTKISFNNLRSITDSDATQPGADYYQRRILGELTLTVKNGTTSHALATGLDV